MDFNSETRVKDIALSNSGARHILEDAGVDFCCGGGKSLQEACLHADISADEVLQRLRQNRQQVAPGQTEWTSAPLAELTQHIKELHHRYVREAIPRVEALLAKVRETHGVRHHELEEIERLFGDVASEMLMHMQKEEMILFPYIDALERSVNKKLPIKPPPFLTVRNPIHMMMKEHDAAGELLKRIRRASNEYTVPADACTSYEAAYQELREFEADLHQHVHLENNILFPRAVELEAAAV